VAGVLKDSETKSRGLIGLFLATGFLNLNFRYSLTVRLQEVVSFIATNFRAHGDRYKIVSEDFGAAYSTASDRNGQARFWEY
jgi:hypothetical protein